jgi:enoyl-CoA hydratase/carnithine racemase
MPPRRAGGQPLHPIYALEGFALAGGCELALLADFVVASETAVFGMPETTLGIFPDIGGTQLLPRIVGAPLAKELIFTGRRIKVDEARAAGLVNHVVPSIGLTLTDEQRALRAGLTDICRRYPGEYWRELDARREYPEKFVDELTQAGYLAALIPQAYGGAGLGVREGALILDDPRQRRQRRRLPRPDVHHGHCAPPRQRGAEASVLAEDRDRRAEAAGLRGDRARRRIGHDPARDHGGAAGRPLRRQRPEDHASNNPTSCCCWRARRPSTRWPGGRTACRSSSSTSATWRGSRCARSG